MLYNQYTPLLRLILSLTAIAFLHGADAAQLPANSAIGLPRFEGYLVVEDRTLLALTARRGDTVIAHAMLELGRPFSGYRLEAFDRKSEVLTLVDASGVRHQLTPPVPTVQNSAPNDGRRAARTKILQDIQDYRAKGMNRFGAANVTVELDGDSLPGSRKANYEAHQRAAAQKGMLFFAVSVDGRWHNIFVPINDTFPHPEQLKGLPDEDVAELRMKWKIAQAEVGARILAGAPVKRHGPTAPPPVGR